jgi:hypothetical protein
MLRIGTLAYILDAHSLTHRGLVMFCRAYVQRHQACVPSELQNVIVLAPPQGANCYTEISCVSLAAASRRVGSARTTLKIETTGNYRHGHAEPLTARGTRQSGQGWPVAWFNCQLQWLFQGKVPDRCPRSGLRRERPTLLTGLGGTKILFR